MRSEGEIRGNMIKILKNGDLVELNLRPDWRFIGESKPYLDFECVLADYPSKEENWDDEKDYLVAQISLEQEPDLSVSGAYMTIIRNLPHGEHEELLVVDLTPDEAIKRISREVVR